jgi:hypothetical protein
MLLIFIKDYTFRGIEFKADTTYQIKDDMFARYLIRKKIAVEYF